MRTLCRRHWPDLRIGLRHTETANVGIDVAGDAVACHLLLRGRPLQKLNQKGQSMTEVTKIALHEARPSTAAANTPWVGRFRVRDNRVVEDIPLAG